MKKRILWVLVACCVGTFLSASMASAGPKGECNRILAKNLGLVQQLENGVAEPVACVDLLGGLIEFILSPNQCLALLANGDLFVQDNNLSATFCDVIVNVCGVPPVLLPPGFCSL